MNYESLTKAQKEFICNGCGSKGGWINPPEFLFNASCNHHDFNYWLGYTEEDRKIADDGFYKAMKVDISNANWYLKPYYHIWAYTYYKAVRIRGNKAFYYADTKKNEVDLNIEMLIIIL